MSRREIFRLLATNCLVFMLSLVGALLGNIRELDAKFMTSCLLLVLGACIAILITLYFTAATEALIDANADRRRVEGALASLPHLVRMIKRRDRFKIYETGDADVSWDFELEIDAEGLTVLPLPVVAERLESAPVEPAIRVRKMIVDGRDEDLRDAYLPVEVRRFMLPRYSNRQTTMDQGVLNVPLPPAIGRRNVHIQIEMTLERAFTNWRTEEFAIIDTPLITDDLTVVLEGGDGFHIVPVRRQERHTVTATLGVVEVLDARESDTQDRRWRRDGGRIEWGTKFPKLGYRYAIVFRMEATGKKPRRAGAPRSASRVPQA